MTKPVGYRCNLKCDYCFYLEKEDLYQDTLPSMSQEMLYRYIDQYIKSFPGDHIDFAWQGGEPTLAGLPFYQRVVQIQQELSGGKTVSNSFQTNGIALNNQWAEFFRDNNFFIGVSVDGQPGVHDKYRISTNGRPTFDKVKNAITLLKKYNVEFNTLTVINDENWNKGKETYDLLKSLGSTNMQFIPIVELDEGSCKSPHNFIPTKRAKTTPYSLPAGGYGQFIMDVFSEWSTKDIGKVHVQTFEMLLAQKLGLPAGLCIFSEECGRNVVMEANGDVYSCDHFVYRDCLIGNINNSPLSAIVDSKQQKKFGRDKRTKLTRQCRDCKYLSMCNGGCPKHRVTTLPNEKHKHNYLCESYYRIFEETEAFFVNAAKSIHKMYA